MALPFRYDHKLPLHCTPTKDFLTRFSIYFGVCVPTPLALISTALGALSILSWLFAQMPQIYKNYQIKSTAGLSIFFLTEWLLGDLTNLLGALFTNQAGWQIVVASYYTFVDICLVVQFFWYTYIKPKWTGTSLHSSQSSNRDDGDSDIFNALSPINTEFSDSPRHEMQQQSIQTENVKSPSEDHAPQFSPVDYEYRSMNSSQPDRKVFDWTAMASPRTVLAGAAASLATPGRAAPILLHLVSVQAQAQQETSTIALAGTILSWCSTLLYLGSRLPQLYKNWSRKSTAGLSPLLFFAAFMGNLFYSTSLLTNPNAWDDFGSYGGHGWAGADGSDRVDWVLRATPFFLGAAGVLFMDGMMGVQFLLYGEREEELVKVRDVHGYSRWEKVNGWMRGWVPRMGSKSRIVDLAESQRLLAESREIERYHERYGALQQSWQ